MEIGFELHFSDGLMEGLIKDLSSGSAEGCAPKIQTRTRLSREKHTPCAETAPTPERFMPSEMAKITKHDSEHQKISTPFNSVEMNFHNHIQLLRF